MNDSAFHEQRLVELETKLAYQEDTLRTLNDIVTAQQAEIERLRVICRQLVERARGTESGIKSASAAEEIPPHY